MSVITVVTQHVSKGTSRDVRSDIFSGSDRSISFRLFLVSSGFSSIFDGIYFFTPFSIKPVRKDVTAKCVSFRASRLPGLHNTYLLLTEFEARTVSYGSVSYSTDQEDEVSKIFYLPIVCLTSSGTISIHEERLQISEAGRKQNESI